MRRASRFEAKDVLGLALGAAIVGLSFARQRKTLRPIGDDMADLAKQGYDNLRQDWSDVVSEATGGVENLKGRSFWSAAGLTLAATFISSCAEQAKKRSDEEARRKAEPTRDDRVAEYRARFQHVSSQPGLVRGRPLRNVTILTPFKTLRDEDGGVVFNFGPGRGDYADPAHFTITYQDVASPPSGLRIQGIVEDFVSNDGRERIFVIGAIRNASKGQSAPYALSDGQIAQIANFFATMFSGERNVPVFVYDDTDAEYWSRYNDGSR